MNATQIRQPLMPVLRDLSGFWIACDLLDLLTGGDSADIVQEESLDSLQYRLLPVFADNRV
ncbi:MAG: hypothetical protein ABSH34_23000 [Verrucomicrobiota bacterium]|jgi:hypothetical protein